MKTKLSDSELTIKLEQVEAERDKAKKDSEFVRQWYSTRVRRLEDWVREYDGKGLPGAMVKEFFAIQANGTANHMENPEYNSQINKLRHLAETARAERDTYKAEGEHNAEVVLATRQLSIDSMRAIRDAVGAPDDNQPAIVYVRAMVSDLVRVTAEREALDKRLTEYIAEKDALAYDLDISRDRTAALRAKLADLERDNEHLRMEDGLSKFYQMQERLAQSEQRRAELDLIITKSLKAAPVGNVTKHTPENLPAIVSDLSQTAGEECSDADRLRARNAQRETELSAVMPIDFKDWHQNSKEELPAVAAQVIKNLRSRITDYENEIVDYDNKFSDVKFELLLEQSERWKSEQIFAEHSSLQSLYNELLYSVSNKYPNESRHQTALRYIRKMEENSTIDSTSTKQK